jgi:pimeloyl-ACP methyl ester carboxylesterase
MTSTGSRRVGRPSIAVLRSVLRRRPPTVDRDTAIAASLATFALIGSPGFAHDDDYRTGLASLSYDRGYDLDGQRRQLAAVAVQTDRTAALAKLTVPTLVIHGLADPLVDVSGGLALAKTIAGARFVGFSGMGHDLPPALWPTFAAEITAHVRRAGTPAHAV